MLDCRGLNSRTSLLPLLLCLSDCVERPVLSFYVTNHTHKQLGSSHLLKSSNIDQLTPEVYPSACTITPTTPSSSSGFKSWTPRRAVRPCDSNGKTMSVPDSPSMRWRRAGSTSQRPSRSFGGGRPLIRMGMRLCLCSSLPLYVFHLLPTASRADADAGNRCLEIRRACRRNG